MNASIPTPLRRFSALWSELEEVWLSAEIRTVSVSLGAGWFNIGTRIQPKTEVNDLDLPDFEPTVEFENLRCVSEVRKASEIPDLLDRIFGGEATVGGRLVKFGQTSNSSQPPTPFTPQIYPRSREQSKTQFGIDFSSFLLWAEGGAPLINFLDSTVYEGLSSALFGMDKPVYGFGDLQMNFLGEEHLRSASAPVWELNWWNPFVKAVLPIPLRFADWSASEDGSVRVTIELLNTLRRERISIAALCDDPYTKKVDRQKKSIVEDISRGRPQIDRRSVTISSVPTRRIQLVLSYGPSRADAAFAYGLRYFASNPRMAAYVAADRLRKRLDELVGSGGGSEFRKGIGALLALIGYQVIDLESIEVKDSFDLLAMTSSPEPFLVVEVTVAEADYRNKITKLSRRARELAASVAPQPVLAVLFTGEDELGTTESEIAAKEGVAVVKRSDLATLGLSLGRPVSLDQVTTRLRNLIPSPSIR